MLCIKHINDESKQENVSFFKKIRAALNNSYTIVGFLR